MRRPAPPIANSYWVLPGRLLAGEHPWGGGEAAISRRLMLLQAAGVRHFIDLTQPGEMQAYSQLLPDTVAYHNLPIPDHSIPGQPARMREIQQLLARQLTAGPGAVYVHCRAGIGRTGTVIGCWLRERGVPSGAVLAELNQLWRHNARAASWPWIPETPEQESYILEWQVEARDATVA
jgi:hypothetical protein